MSRRVRTGVTLPVVVMLLAATVLLTGAVLASATNARTGARDAWRALVADAALDAAAAQTLAEVQRDPAAHARLVALHDGEHDTLPPAIVGALQVHADLTRTGAFDFPVRLTVQDSLTRRGRRFILARGTRRTWRLVVPSLPVHAALDVAGGVTLLDGVTIDANEHVPAGWDTECGLEHDGGGMPWYVSASAVASATFAASPVPGLTAAAGTPVRTVVTDPPARAAELGASLAAIASRATGVVTDSVLDLATLDAAGCPRFGGDATRPGTGSCARRWPILHATAARVRLVGGAPVQGILVTDGDLVLGPGVRWHGLLLVRGRLRADTRSGAVAHVTGAVVVGEETPDAVRLAHVALSASRCAVRRSLATAGVIRDPGFAVPDP